MCLAPFMASLCMMVKKRESKEADKKETASSEQSEGRLLQRWKIEAGVHA